MALAFSNLTAGRNAGDPSTTASITPTSGAVVLLTIALIRTTSEATNPTDSITVSGLSGTWTKMATTAFGADGRGWLFQGTGLSGSGAITIDYTGPGSIVATGWVVDQATGQNTTTPLSNVASENGIGANIVVTTSGTPDTDDATYSTVTTNATSNWTPESGWTALGENATNPRTESAYDLTSPIDTSCTWSHGSALAENAAFIGIVNINTAPSVNAGADATGNTGTAFSRTAIGTDSEGDTLTYAWTIQSKPGGSSATLTGASTATVGITPDIIGDYTLRCTVTDPQGLTGFDDFILTAITPVPTSNTTAQRFYESSVDQDQAWGTDVDKLTEGTNAVLSTTIAQHPNAAGTTTITLDPYTSRSTQTEDNVNFGWAINQGGDDGMGSVATAKRRIPAGTWRFLNRVSLPAGGSVSGSHNVTGIYSVYRVAAGGGTRTLLFTHTSAEMAGQQAAASTVTIDTTTASQPEYLMEEGETLHVAIQSRNRQVAGALGATTAGNLTWHTGGAADAFIEVPTPGIRTSYYTTVSDTLVLTDTVTRVTTYTRVSTDNEPLSDLITLVVAYARGPPDDALGLTDLISVTVTYAVTQTDALGLTDVASAVFTGDVTIADPLGAVDSVSQVGSLTHTAVDSLGVTDAANQEASFVHAATDFLGLSDAVIQDASFIQTATDPLGLVDSTSGSIAKIETDSFGLADTATQVGSFVQTVTDLGGLADTVTVVVSYLRDSTDLLGLTDSVHSSTIELVTDTESLADSHNMHLGLLHHRSLAQIGTF